MDKLDYSSDSDNDSHADHERKRQKVLPPLPNAIKDKYHKPPTSKSDPMSKPRFGLIANVPRHWVNTYTSVDVVPSLECCDKLDGLVKNVNMVMKYARRTRPTELKGLYENELRIVQPLHVSMTDNSFVRREERETYKVALKDAVTRLELNKRLTFDKVKILPNNTTTGVFATLTLDKESKERIRPLFDAIQSSLASSAESKVLTGPELVGIDALHVSFASTTDTFLFKLDDLEELDTLCSELDVDPKLEMEYDSLKVVDKQATFHIDLC